jgi:hypothetical protein
MKDGAKQPVDSVINSNVAAWEFQKIQASYVQTDNGGSPFGIASTFIKKLIYKDTDFKGTWSNLGSPADVLEALDGADLDDHQIRLV